MFALVRSGLGGLLLVAVLAATGAAEAATVNVFSTKTYGRSQLGLAQAAMAAFRAGHTISNLHVETFEGFRPWSSGTGTQDLSRTRVGSFTPFGTKGAGRAVVGDGARLQVRNDNAMHWGRYDTDKPALSPGLADGNWLDSNDNLGIRWRIEDLGGFNTLAFFVIDAADVGGSFSLKIGNRLYSDLNAGKRLRNGNIHLVHILLPRTRHSLTVRLMHDRSDDGFGIDGALVAQVVPPSPVPLPPAAALIVPALALLAGLRRSKRRA